MTSNEKRLHKMMTDPGPAPVHDANGWPVTVGTQVRHKLIDDLGWVRDLRAGAAFVVWDHADDDWVPVEDLVAEPPTKDSAGPADLRASATPSGTGGPNFHLPSADGVPQAGLVDTADSLLAYTQSAARRMTAIAEELEGRRRELWDRLVRATHRARQPDAGRAEAAHANTWRDAYALMAGVPSRDLKRLLDAELDARYGADRAKDGEPR